MDAREIYRLMENTSLLDKDTLPQLKQMTEEYPYFHAARILYLKNLAVLDDIHFSSELKKMIIYIPDRKKLFKLIEGAKYHLESDPAETLPEGEPDGDSFSLIDSFLTTQNREPGADPNLLFRPSATSDYLYWDLTNKPQEQEEDEANKLQHQDLIDSFLRKDQEREPGRRLPLDRKDDAIPIDFPVDEEGKPDESKALDDSFFTETLAQIYIKQKRYEKALQIIQKLSLKYPEKNVYFADQIRFLEKLIINTKKTT